MAVKIEKTDKQTRFVTGTEAAYNASKASFANDAFMCTDSGALYVRGGKVRDRNPSAGEVTFQNKEVGMKFSPIVAASLGMLTNAFAFLRRECITVEQSEDDGATWTDITASCTDYQLGALFTTPGLAYLSLGKNADLSNQLRITCLLDGWNDVYCKPCAVCVNMSGCGNNIWMEVQTQSDNQANAGEPFSTIKSMHVMGDSSWNELDMDPETTTVWGGQYAWAARRVRFLFRYDKEAGYTYSGTPTIYSMCVMSMQRWASPSNLARIGTLYSYDQSQNATFPANLSAAKLLQGSNQVVDTAGTGLTKSGSTLAVNGSAVMNSLTVDTSDAQMADYYICQYAGGGTTTTTYHRRKVSSLYNCLKVQYTTGENATALLNKLGQAADVPSDDKYVVLSGASAGDSTFYRRKLPLLAEYVAGKLPTASATAAGLMSAADKAALDGTAVARVALSASSQLPEDAGAAFMTADAAARDGRQLLLTMDSGQGAQATIAAVSVMTTGSLVMIDAFWNGKARRLTLTNTGSEVTVTAWADL